MKKGNIHIYTDPQLHTDFAAIVGNVTSAIVDFMRNTVAINNSNVEQINIKIIDLNIQKLTQKMSKLQAELQKNQDLKTKYQDLQLKNQEKQLKEDKEKADSLHKCVRCKQIRDERIKMHNSNKGLVCDLCRKSMDLLESKEYW